MKIHIFPRIKLTFITVSKNFVIELVNLKTLDDWNVKLLLDRILIQFFTKSITLPQS